MGTGIAHSILLFAVVIATGLYLGRFKLGGISLGATWILFFGILVSHFGFRSNPTVLAFMKDFGLILFVFSIGLQVGPGFFSSLRQGGLRMNLLACLLVVLGVVTTYLLHLITGESIETMTGVMSGAVTNTPGLGAAQQTIADVMVANGATKEAAIQASTAPASAYAVAYPIGVLGVILVIVLIKALFKIDTEKEKQALDLEEDNAADTARRMHCEVVNPAIIGLTLRKVLAESGGGFVISRMMRDGVVFVPDSDTVFKMGDKLLIVTSQPHVDSIRIIFGEEIPMHQKDWQKIDDTLVTRRLVISRSQLTGKRIKDLRLRSDHGVTVTRVIRAGVELVAGPNLILQMGDSILVVGTEHDIRAIAEIVGNKAEKLSHPNLIPIFAGIAIGVIFGSLPIRFPGIPQPVKLGLAGGPLLIAILLGHFGPKWHITTYTTQSANMMIREIGISFFLAAVGLGAGADFVSSLVNGGYWWILYGAVITIVPVLAVGLLARMAFKMNFFQIAGLLCGSTTNAPVLAFTQDAYGTDYTSINYATVYPLSMFLRVLLAQLLILIAL